MSLGLIGHYGTDSDSSISDSDDDGYNSHIIAEPEACSEETCGDDNTTAISPDTPPGGRAGDEASPSDCVDPLSLGLESSGDSEPSDSDSEGTGSPCPPRPPDCFQAAVTPLPLPNMDMYVRKSEQVSSLVPSSSVDKGVHMHTGGEGEGGAVENSVFFNPFKRAEEDRLAILKRHVNEFDKKPKVTEDPAHPRGSETRGGYRRSRSRRGQTGSSRSHHQHRDHQDHHVPIPPPSSYARHGTGRGGAAGETHQSSYGRHGFRGSVGGAGAGDVPMPAAAVHHFSSEDTGAPHHYHSSSGEPPPSEEEKPRKHRSGVTNSLVPPKKFMKMHEKIQAKERPWTLK